MRLLAALVLTLGGCAYDDRRGGTLSPEENAAVLEVAERYASYFPVRPDCLELLPQSRVLIADREAMLKLCWRDEPGRCAAGESRSKWGCAAACLDVQGVCGFLDHDCDHYYAFVVSNLLTPTERLYAVRHEAVHALGHCHKNYLATEHTEPFYQIAEGP